MMTASLDVVPPPPTNPSGPGGPSQATAAAAAAKVLTQEAVTEALGADVPPRDAAERVTFATWAIVTGKSPGGIFNELPAVDDATATKLSERLSERAEGIVLSLVRDGKEVAEAALGDDVAIVVNQTPFYGESGGQMGDAGVIASDTAKVAVADTQKKGEGLFVLEPGAGLAMYRTDAEALRDALVDYFTR